MRLIGNLSHRPSDIRSDSANFLLRPSFEALRWELLHNNKVFVIFFFSFFFFFLKNTFSSNITLGTFAWLLSVQSG